MRRSKLVCSAAVMLATHISFSAVAESGEASVELVRPLTPELRALALQLLPTLPYWNDIFTRSDADRVDIDKNVWGARARLDGDGPGEVLFEIRSYSWCGRAGCPLRIFKRDRDGWKDIGGDSSEALSITILDQTDQGFHRIGAGYLPECREDRIFRWDGKGYSVEDPCAK